MDAYNGTILWSFQTPNVRRANMTRDSSNMVATDDYLYIIEGPRCYAVNAQTGERDKVFTVPRKVVNGKQMDWGYLAAVGDQLIGTANERGANYLGDDGEWFEDLGDGDVGKVASHYAFAMDRHTGKVQWVDDQGVKANATMTIEGGRLFFAEAAPDAGATITNGRFIGKLPEKMTLRALDLKTGETQWSKPVDFSAYRFMLYLSAGDDKVLAVGSDEGKHYHAQAFNQSDGEVCWDRTEKDRKGHHSGHLQHPVIIGDKLYLNKMILSMHDGAIVREGLLDRRGCSVMAAGANGIAYRNEFHSFWDLESDQRTEFLGIRGGCWLGPIPAGGMLLAPETSAGCSCTHAIQTSIGYVPKDDVKGPAK
jgi:outer membrane protein assembly factor BamB